uniref:Uncharacterized protein n=1 Tax=Chromera velia CCMP2878 TaxID=1169474 RepID=A0A0G4HRG6_9ALVE|eukprot:Cvel_8087.t1-p1 / transcript=Cvel_8087.t1 / gene=Cvel_8087 / organism=Chromera_velia_CCMP2878 / gene_product=hypothetical protein / transcript_product=hypothetical protein / location=Cvel_scaffold439:19014-20625(+) / protein_length=233 / sequence_SO=supercontig / SO=protein_coding / is_pseudo=false
MDLIVIFFFFLRGLEQDSPSLSEIYDGAEKAGEGDTALKAGASGSSGPTYTDRDRDKDEGNVHRSTEGKRETAEGEDEECDANDRKTPKRKTTEINRHRHQREPPQMASLLLPPPPKFRSDSHVLSEYIHRPLLVGGHKLNLRLYALITRVGQTNHNTTAASARRQSGLGSNWTVSMLREALRAEGRRGGECLEKKVPEGECLEESTAGDDILRDASSAWASVNTGGRRGAAS